MDKGGNVFKGARFGDLFRTRGGGTVMFLFYLDDVDAYHCVSDDWYGLLDYAPDGKAYVAENHRTDIVGRTTALTAEEDLVRMAKAYDDGLPYVAYEADGCGGLKMVPWGIVEAFKAGFRAGERANEKQRLKDIHQL